MNCMNLASDIDKDCRENYELNYKIKPEGDLTKISDVRNIVTSAKHYFGNIDISPIIVYLLLWFLQNLLIEYWPR